MEHYHVSHPWLQIRNSSIISYCTNESSRAAPAVPCFVKKETGEVIGTYSGTVTNGAKKRIRIAVDLMMQCVENVRVYNPVVGKMVDHRLSFVTLTLSDNTRFITATEANKNVLRPFLSWLTRTLKCKFYIWKAERQKELDVNGKKKLSNGQLHYHITTDVFIVHDELRHKWNGLQKEAGYLEDYRSKYHSYNPNSTDIHEVYDIDNLEGYLMKYISKEPDKKEDETDIEFKERISVNGKVWDCSRNLKGKKFFKVEWDKDLADKLDVLVKDKKVVRKDTDYTRVYYFNSTLPYKILKKDNYLQYLDYKKSIINNEPKIKEPPDIEMLEFLKGVSEKELARIECKVSLTQRKKREKLKKARERKASLIELKL